MKYRDLITDDRFKNASEEDREKFRSNYFKKYVSEDPEVISQYREKAMTIESEVLGESKPSIFDVPNPMNGLEGQLTEYAKTVPETTPDMNGIPEFEREFALQNQSSRPLDIPQEMIDLSSSRSKTEPDSAMGAFNAGVSDSMTVKGIQAIEGIDTQSTRIEKPRYSFDDYMSNNEIDGVKALDALKYNLSYYAGKLAPELIPLGGVAKGGKFVTQGIKAAHPWIAKAAAGAINFGAYMGGDKGLNFLTGREESETPVMDTLKEGAKGAAIGAIMPFVELPVALATGLAGKVSTLPLKAATEALKKTERFGGAVTKAAEVSAKAKEILKVNTATEIAKKTATLAAEDYTMVGLTNKLNGGNFTDVSFQDMLENTPLSITMHVANKYSGVQSRDALREAFDIVNQKSPDRLDLISDVKPDKKHSSDFGKAVAEEMFNKSRGQKDLLDLDGKPVLKSNGRKVMEFSREKTLEKILEQSSLPENAAVMRKVMSDPVARDAFESSLSSRLTKPDSGGKFESFNGMSLKDVHSAIRDRSAGKMEELNRIDQEIAEKTEQWEQEYSSNLDPATGMISLDYAGSFRKVLDAQNEVLRLQKERADVQKKLGPSTKVKINTLKTDKAQSAYDKYNNKVDVEKQRQLIETSTGFGPEQSGIIARSMSLTDAQINHVVKTASRRVSWDKSTLRKELVQGLRGGLENGGRFVRRYLGETVYDVVIKPMRRAEALKVQEDVAETRVISEFARKLSKEQRIKASLYMLAKQGGDSAATALAMVQRGEVFTRDLLRKKKYINEIPDRATIDKEGIGPWVDYMETKLAEYQTRLEATREMLGMEEIPWIENYFSLIRNAENMKEYDLDWMLVGSKRFENASDPKYKEQMHNDFLKKREGGTGSVELDSVYIMNIYGMAARKTIHTVPIGLKAYEIGKAISHSGQAESGLVLQKIAMDFNGALSDNINTAWKKVGYRVYKNTMTSILELKLSTVITQITSLTNTMMKLGPINTIEAVVDLMENPDLYKEVLARSDHMKTRVMETTLDSQKGFEPNKAARVVGVYENLAFTPLKAMDKAVAAVTWATAYKQAKKVHMLSEGDARSYADEMVVSTQGSASRIDRAPIQRSLTGKIATTFQTFTINQWNFLLSDIMDIDAPYKYVKDFKSLEDAKAFTDSLGKNERKLYQTETLETGEAVVYRKDKTQSYFKASKELAFMIIAGYLTNFAYDEINRAKHPLAPKVSFSGIDPIGATEKALTGRSASESLHGDEGDDISDLENYQLAGNAVKDVTRDLSGLTPIVGSGLSWKADSIVGATVQTGIRGVEDLTNVNLTEPSTLVPVMLDFAQLGIGTPGTDEFRKFLQRKKSFDEKAEKDSKPKGRQGRTGRTGRTGHSGYMD